MTPKSVNMFKLNKLAWKLFGIWPESSCSKLYSSIFLFLTLVLYNTLLTINLFFTPLQLDLLIREVIFSFTELAVTFKMLMILTKKEEIIAVFKIFDSQTFEAEDKHCKDIIDKHIKYFKIYWNTNAILSNFSYSAQVFFPLLTNFISGSIVELPICSYYFLNDEYKSKYFGVWYFYQSFGMYGHMMYNVTTDSFVAGTITMLIAQTKVLNYKLRNLKVDKKHSLKETHVQDKILITRLKKYLKHYDVIMECHTKVQVILNLAMFMQFAVTSAIICVTLCGLYLGPTTETFMFLVTYLIVIGLQIFIPAWLGTQYSHECNKLSVAAYSCDWIPRSEGFKRSLKVFVEKTNATVVLKGLKMFPLSLGTFVSIMKTAYSFFALVQNVQTGQGNK
nr:odorant receptor 38 [Achelura yunnanensis]